MIKKSKLNSFFFRLCVFICIFILIGIPTTISANTDDLTQKLNDLNKQLEDIKNKKKLVEDQINKEANNQKNLTSQLTLYDKRIESLGLTLEEKQKYIETLQTEILLSTSKIKDKEKDIADLEKQLIDVNNIYKDRVISNFQNSFRSSIDIILQDSFETYMIKRGFENSIATENQKVADQLTLARNNLDQEKQLLIELLVQQQLLQDQVKAETADLAYQQQGLEYQKEEKARVLEQSKNTTAALQKQREELNKIANEKQAELDSYLLQIISKRGNGSPVKKGDAIGKMGRSGYVLTCNSKGCYYPDPDKEPCGGAHLHFEVAKKHTDGKYYRADPEPYLRNGIISSPMRSYTYTQYYQGTAGSYSPFAGFNKSNTFVANPPGIRGHAGIDLWGDSGCGTTLYAGVNGVISYYCRNFQWPGYRPDPTFFAVVYDPINDINITYMHLQKAPGTC